MSRLVVVSNRVPPPKGKQAAGGLAVGVLAALREKGGVWFGWSGNLVADAEERRLELIERGRITYALLDLTEAEQAGHYGGMANRTLWPLFHYRIDLTSFEHEWYRVYREVARLFAERLMPLLRPGDLVWVQDFHLIPLATELRRLGWQGRLGFFLHIPFPPQQLYATLPWHRELGEDFCAYDAIGFQTPTDREHFADYAVRELGAEQLLDEDWLRLDGRPIQVQATPIGIPMLTSKISLASTLLSLFTDTFTVWAVVVPALKATCWFTMPV